MHTRDEATLLDIARAARLAMDFVAETDVAGFEKSLLVQSAVLHQMMVLGEAMKRLSPDFTARHPEIPWRAMARMRDRLIHGYDRIHLPTLWETVTVDLPDVLRQLGPLLPRSPEGEET